MPLTIVVVPSRLAWGCQVLLALSVVAALLRFASPWLVALGGVWLLWLGWHLNRNARAGSSRRYRATTIPWSGVGERVGRAEGLGVSLSLLGMIQRGAMSRFAVATSAPIFWRCRSTGAPCGCGPTVLRPMRCAACVGTCWRSADGPRLSRVRSGRWRGAG